ncbi:MAG: pyridoxamine 5'-phosphate oxidase family protein [Candidatus Omnitrophica bacterium]|nr:pyridoxamine 5'-phosphate oxidase family protein [Candidatus Omnitrophota bacterium]
MRRNEKEITDKAVIDSIIRRCEVCRLGMSDNGQPYVVPLNFGYDGQVLYFHCAKKGRKLDILRKNNQVCLEFDMVERVVEADTACEWGTAYKSVIGFGTARLIEDAQEKKKALDLLMAHYSNRSFSYLEAVLKRTAVVKVTIHTLTGKQSI